MAELGYNDKSPCFLVGLSLGKEVLHAYSA